MEALVGGSATQDAAGAHGHQKDADFEGALERGIGHGRHTVGAADHLFGAAIPTQDNDMGLHGSQKRHIPAQMDHMRSFGTTQEEAPGLHGHSVDDDLQEGLQHGIGHGRHHYAQDPAQDHFANEGTTVSDGELRRHGHQASEGIVAGLSFDVGHGRHKTPGHMGHMVQVGVAQPEHINRGEHRHYSERDLVELNADSGVAGAYHGRDKDVGFSNGQMTLGHEKRHISDVDNLSGVAVPKALAQGGADAWEQSEKFVVGPQTNWPVADDSSHRRHAYHAADHIFGGGAAAEVVGQHGHSKDDEFESDGLERGIGHGRHFIGVKDHMMSDGVSMPDPMRHGQGRRYIQAIDHEAYRQDIDDDSTRLVPGQGRKHIIADDHLFSDVMRPVEDIHQPRIPSNEEMKDAIREWIIAEHRMIVANEAKFNDVTVQPRGPNWVIEAFNAQRKTLSREGSSARQIAERLSMMPVAELRHFGIRFATHTEQQILAARPKTHHFEANPSFMSPGMYDALGNNRQGVGPGASDRAKIQLGSRKYLSSGKDHFDSTQAGSCEVPGTHGHGKDDDFEGAAIERGIGKGKRFIGTRDHLFGGCAVQTPVG